MPLVRTSLTLRTCFTPTATTHRNISVEKQAHYWMSYQTSHTNPLQEREKALLSHPLAVTLHPSYLRALQPILHLPCAPGSLDAQFRPICPGQGTQRCRVGHAGPLVALRYPRLGPALRPSMETSTLRKGNLEILLDTGFATFTPTQMKESDFTIQENIICFKKHLVPLGECQARV